MNEKKWKLLLRNKLFSRLIITYVIFCLIGFIATSFLSSGDELSFLHLTITVSELKAFFFTGYYLIYVILTLAALLILFVYIFNISRPLKRIVREATAYADGHYETPISFTARNELGILADILNCMARELSTLEEDQKKFVSNVSHDFRSPLTSIKGFAEAMADGTIPPELQEKYLHIIIEETERLEKLTQSLLELNNYSARGAYMDYAVFDLHEKIRRAVSTFEGRSQQKDLHIRLQFSEAPLLVRADAEKIDQVLHNLLDNAIKFSNDGGEIHLSTSLQNGKVFVSVRDFGMGIPRDAIGKIWDRFYKTDLSRGKDKTGTGLGLAIVKEIIAAHHENINVISTEGVGTEFIFTLSQPS